MGQCKTKLMRQEAPPAGTDRTPTVERRISTKKSASEGDSEESKSLLTIPFFDELDKKNARLLGEFCERREMEADAVIAEEGKTNNYFNIIVSGKVKVSAKDEKGTVVELYTLGAGDWFGDWTLFGATILCATIVATEKTTLLSLSNEKFKEFVAKIPDARASVQTNSFGSPPVRVALSGLPFFSQVEEMKMQLLGGFFQFTRCRKSDIVCRQGDPAECFYIMVKGQADVSVKGQDGHDIHLSVIRRDDWFGEIALLENTTRTATITASQDCLLLYLTRERFQTFLKVCPEVLKSTHFENVVRQRTAGTLKSIPFFSVLKTKDFGPLQRFDEEKLGLLGSLFTFSQFGSGDVIFREGDEGTCLFIIVYGQVSVIGKNEADQAVQLGTLKDGEWLGETALFNLTRRTATIIAEIPTVVLRLDQENFQRFLEVAPEFRGAIEQMVSQRTAERLRHIPFFASVKENKPWSKLGLLGGLFVFEEFAADTVVCKQGENGNKFYIVVRGSLEVTTNNHLGERVVLTKLKNSDWFGEIALMQDAPRTATIVTTSPCILLSITADKFTKFLSIAPELKDTCQAIMNLRTATTLKTVRLFSNIKENKPWSKFELLASLLVYEQREKDEVIFSSGDAPDKLYVILKGSVRLSLPNDAGDVFPEPLKTGDYFGEVELLEEEPRLSSAIALEGSFFLTMSKDAFKKFVRLAPEAARSMNDEATRRRSIGDEAQRRRSSSDPGDPNAAILAAAHATPTVATISETAEGESGMKSAASDASLSGIAV
eukprot:Opistho-2@93063